MWDTEKVEYFISGLLKLLSSVAHLSEFNPIKASPKIKNPIL